MYMISNICDHYHRYTIGMIIIIIIIIFIIIAAPVDKSRLSR